MRALKSLLLLVALVAFACGTASAKSTKSYAGTYGLDSANATGSLKLTQVKGAMHQFEIMVYAKDGATCNIDGMIEIEDGLGIFRGTFQKCSLTIHFDKGKAMVDSGKACDQCGGKATIDGAYVKGKMSKMMKK